MDTDFQVEGKNAAALFTLKLHRGDGMALVAMNWKKGRPPNDFVGFAIEYKEPGGEKFFALNNRLAFPAAADAVNPNRLSTLLSPIQKFRWVHFPRNAEIPGEFTYRVTPVFMDATDRLSYGEAQTVAIALDRKSTRLNSSHSQISYAVSHRALHSFPTRRSSDLFPAAADAVNPNRLSTLLSPIQKFRWVHFPRNAEIPGEFTYRVTPVFMDATDRLSYGEAQTVAIA